MASEFSDIIAQINKNYGGIAADNSKTKFTWALNVTWDKIPLDNPMVQKAIKTDKFKKYFIKWYSNWHNKTTEGKVECFEAALVSFIGFFFKTAINKHSDGKVDVLAFICNTDNEDEKFDYIECPLDNE